MTRKLQTYEAPGIIVTFDPTVCAHSGACVRGLPSVFDVSQTRWIQVEKAMPEAIATQVSRCPSGALHVVRPT